MNIPHAANDLVAALARQLGIEGLALDDDGLRAFEIGEKMTVHLQADPASHEFVLYAVAGSLPADPPAARLLELLNANRFWRDTGGATLSVDDERPPRVIMARRVSWVGTTPAEFNEAFATFVDYLADWWTRLDHASQGSAPPPMPMFDRHPGNFA